MTVQAEAIYVQDELDCHMRYLSECLCYDLAAKHSGDLLSALTEYRMLVCAVMEALQAFARGDLEKFDGLVGENACQIRAVRIACMYSHCLLDVSHYFSRCQTVLQGIKTLLEPSTIARLMTNKLSLQQVFDSNDLDIQISTHVLFAFQSYLLTEMRDESVSEDLIPSLYRKRKCSPSKIRRIDPEVSPSFAHRLASHLRKNLACASVEYVRGLAGKTQDPHLIRMVSDHFTVTHNALSCIPMFWTYKILLHSAQQSKLPLIVHMQLIERHSEGYRVKEESQVLFFRPNEASYESLSDAYVLCTPQEQDLEQAACVIQGVACADSWNTAALQQSITDVILAGAADHRQYPNPDCIVPIDDAEYDCFKLAAQTGGFSSENPSTFFIRHVYPSLVKKHM